MKINPNRLKTRDRLMVRLINGATKSGIARDRKKEADKYFARDRRGLTIMEQFDEADAYAQLNSEEPS